VFCPEIKADLLNNNLVKNKKGTMDKEKFKLYLANEGLQQSTIDVYMIFIKELLEDCDPPTDKNIRGFVDTHHRHIVARAVAKRWVNFYTIETGVKDYRNIEIPKLTGKKKTKTIKSIRPNDFDIMFNHPSTTKFQQLFMLLLRDTGCRISELLDVKVSDVKEHEGKLEIFIRTSKTGERIVLLSRKTQKMLKEHIYNHKLTEITHILPFRTRQRAWQIIQSISYKSLNTKISPHQFRHTCANTLIMNNVSVVDVQSYLGHKNINSTMVYVNSDQRKVKKEFNRVFNKEDE